MNIIMIGEKIALRLKSLFSFAAIIAVVLTTNKGLLHIQQINQDRIVLACLIVVALSKPVASVVQERK